MKRDFLDIYLTTVFGVGKFKNTSAMRVIFFLKMLKLESKIRKKKTAKIFFVSEINASVNVARNSLFLRREILVIGSQ